MYAIRSYYENYVVLDAGDSPLQKGQLLSDEKYHEAMEEHAGSFVANMGAEAIRELLAAIDLDEVAEQLRLEMKDAASEAKRKKVSKRLKVAEAFLASGNRPEWMILETIPVFRITSYNVCYTKLLRGLMPLRQARNQTV